MAKPTEINMTLAELVRVSEASRVQLAESQARLRNAFDIPNRIKESLVTQPGKWLGVSLLTGFAISFIFRRKKAPAKVTELKRQRGFLLGLLSLAFTVGKPLAKAYAAKMLKDRLSARFGGAPLGQIERRNMPPY
jgi:hypothetical protein